jgi:type II secretory pathway predicted ATPase ExeA
MSYLDHFGLTAEPFSNAPVSRFYFNAPQHQQALTRLLYAVSSMKGLAVLVGDIGAGKTTLARRMLDSLPEEDYEAALLVIIHSGITASWILRRIALQLGVENPAQEKLALLSQLYQRLLQIYEQGRKAVVLIDEAQMLETRELMEEFRGLLNLEVPERKLISFVFFGLPEIEKNLKLDPPLAQRVAMRYRLESFNANSTEAYIKHRMRLAGSARSPFTVDAMQAVHRRASGTPRVINTLCDNALFEAFLARSQDINAALIEQIADNLGLEVGAAPQPVAPAVAQPSLPPIVESAVAPVTVPSAGSLQVVPGSPSANRRDPELASEHADGGLRVTATVQGGSVAVGTSPLIALSPSGTRSFMPRPSGPAGASLVPAAPPIESVAAGPTPSPVVQGFEEQPTPAPADANPGAAPASKPRTGVDLAEIDRYLEGLGKL